MEEVVFRQTAQRRLNTLLLGLFGLLGLVIAAVGILRRHGVYVVSQRTREIGVRIALGATRSKVMGMVLANACVSVAAGLIIGGVGAWSLSAAAKAFLFGLEPNDPRAFVAALVSLSLAALVASIIPARRAARVDPIVALRAECRVASHHNHGRLPPHRCRLDRITPVYILSAYDRYRHAGTRP